MVRQVSDMMFCLSSSSGWLIWYAGRQTLLTKTSLCDYMSYEETVIMTRIDDAVLFGDADRGIGWKINDRCLKEKLLQGKLMEV